MLSKIEGLVNYCYPDEKGIEFQLFLISVKCLMPYENNIGCLFDIERYKKEIDLFAFYMDSHDEVIDYWLKNRRPADLEDELLDYKIIPIITANTRWEEVRDEVIRAVTFYTLNKNAILNGLLISSAIFEYLDGEIENIEPATRERLVNFSIKDTFAANQMPVQKNYLIDFEKERIKLISKPSIFDDKARNKYMALGYIFNKGGGGDESTSHASEDNKGNEDKKQITIKDSFSSYLYKLRKGTINPEKLKIPDKIPDIGECIKYPSFNHPLLGRCRVVNRTEGQVTISNKSGLMRIRI